MHTKLFESKPLFKECVEALGAEILNDEESDKMTELFQSVVPLTRWGKVDWQKVDKKVDIGISLHLIIPTLKQLLKKNQIDTSIYIDWSSCLPVIKTNINKVIEHFDDVTCVAFEKFLFNPLVGYVIEIRTGDDMTVGLIPRTSI